MPNDPTIWPPLIPFVQTPPALIQEPPAAPAPAPPTVIPQPVAQSVNWAPAAPLPMQTTYVPIATTAKSTVDFFGVVNQNAVASVEKENFAADGTPAVDADPIAFTRP